MKEEKKASKSKEVFVLTSSVEMDCYYKQRNVFFFRSLSLLSIYCLFLVYSLLQVQHGVLFFIIFEKDTIICRLSLQKD